MTSPNNSPISADVLIVGAGPAGSAAALHAARLGLDTLLIDAAEQGRDKTCGDGLTPRAVHQLDLLGLAKTVTEQHRNQGLKLHGFGTSVTAAWPVGAFGDVGSAMPRRRFDALLVDAAIKAGARFIPTCAATDVEFSGAAIDTVIAGGHRIRARSVIVADGVASRFGKKLGRAWHRGEVFGTAARSYCATPHSQDPWIHSHLELRDESGTILPGYGWIFPLGDGDVNLGCGALSTDKRPAKVNTKKLLSHYASTVRDEWRLGPERDVTSALLPLGGAVSNVAGKNWMLIGDAAACVNPLNGEGIDYGLETAALAVAALGESDYTLLWPHTLRDHYGEAFTLARTAACLLTWPQFLPITGPVAFRLPLMPAAARLMGNLVTDEDRDVISRAWRAAGKVAFALNGGRPLWSIGD